MALTQNDIRELQLAKGAIASGMRLLLRRWGAKPDVVEVVHLAGAFGNYVRIDSAVRIGLLETAPCRIHAAGNTALQGAKMTLLSPTLRFPGTIEHIALASEPKFPNIRWNSGRLAGKSERGISRVVICRSEYTTPSWASTR